MKTRPTSFPASPLGRSRLTAIAAGAAVAITSLFQTAAAQPIDPAQAGPSLKGWGTSLAWWANVSGSWSNPAAFEELMDAVFDVETGLGLTIVRYNIGAGQNPELPNNYMLPGRLMPSYKSGPDAPFNPIPDRAQQRVLQASLERGVQYVEANGNSPPWWMTVTQDSSGNPNGSNLAPANYTAYAEYLADVAEWFRDTEGVTFNSLTPLNEPSATWWDGNGNQEGCTIVGTEHPALLTALRTALDERGLPDIPVSGPEEWSTEWSRTVLNGYPNDVLESLAYIATHSYNVDNRVGLNALSEALDKPLWMTEYGTGSANEFESGMQLARRIIGDFREMPRLEAWIIWQVLSTSHFSHTWSCMLSNFANRNAAFTYRPQYHTFAQFSRFIRPGSRVIPNPDSNAIVAFQPALERLVITAVNDGTSARPASFDLSAFETLPGSARSFRTSRTERLVERPLFPVPPSGTFQANLTPESVTTFILDGVTADELPPTDWDANGRLTEGDVQAFVTAVTRGADETDLDNNGATDAFDMLRFLTTHDAAGPEQTVFALDFDGVATGSLGDVSLGNGTSGGHYVDGGIMYVQAFNANSEDGGTNFRLTGLELEAGRSYTVRIRAADFNQNWTIGGGFTVGLSETEPTLTDAPTIASGSFAVSPNSGSLPMRFVEQEFSFVAASDLTDPFIILRTDSVSQGNQRIGFSSISVGRAHSGG